MPSPDDADESASAPLDPASDRALGGALEAARRGRGGKAEETETETDTDTDAPMGSTPVPRSEAIHKFRYRLAGEIGRGGMGSVLKAIDKDLRRPVAMKVTLHDSNEAQRLRFVEEAQITGQLEHPSIVPVHELGTDQDGRLFFTMKLVDGRSLAEIFKLLRHDDAKASEDFTIPKLVAILVEVANAVAFAHHRGVLHRDIKPANLMIGRFGEVVVMDWGLAKVVGDQRPITARRTRRGDTDRTARAPAAKVGSIPVSHDLISNQRSSTSLNTVVGTVVGTPAYMSPEQARGDTNRITRSSDVYSLGALLYEMLTLTPPVRGSSPQSTIAQVIAGRIDPPEQRAPTRAIPTELSAIAMKALHPEPARRYTTVEDFRRDLELYLDNRAVSAKADSAWETIAKLVRRNRAASAAVLIGVMLVASITVFAYLVNVAARHRAERGEAQARAAEAQADRARIEAEVEHRGRSSAQRSASLALIFQARFQIDGGRIDDALKAIDLALTFAPDLAEALLLRGQVRMAQHDYEHATPDLDQYLHRQATDADGQVLAQLCARGIAEKASPSLDAQVAATLTRQGALHLATMLATTLDQQMPGFRKQLGAAWPGAGAELSELPDGGLSFDGRKFGAAIGDLAPLHGLPIRRLVLNECAAVADLTPLRGMPLESLDLDQCSRISDIAPLAGLRLSHLNLRNCYRITDFSPLKDMPLEDLDLSECRRFSDFSMLAQMPLRFLALRSCDRLRDLTPLASLKLRSLIITNTPVSDLAPLASMHELHQLYILECPVTDLAPLIGLPALNDIYLPAGRALKGLDLLRKSARLKAIDQMPAEDYWRRHEAGDATRSDH